MQFCKIYKMEISSKKLYENGKVKLEMNTRNKM